MATHRSAEKRIRQNDKIRQRKQGQKSAVRTAIKKMRALIEKKELPQAQAELPKVTKIIAKGVNKNLYHKRNAARKISRIMKQVAKLQQTLSQSPA